MILGVTGHRPSKLGGWDDRDNPTANAVRAAMREQLETLAPERVLTGMALGVDMWAAELCVQLGIPFDAYVPFEGQDSVWPMYQRYRHTRLIYAARRLVVVSVGGYAPEKMQKRNERLVDDCDQLLAVFDGSKGGTFNCVRYALETGKPIIYVRPGAS